MDRNQERNSLLAANTTDAIDRDRIHRIANIADILRQLGFDASPGINGILVRFNNPNSKYPAGPVHISIEMAAVLARFSTDLKALGVL